MKSDAIPVEISQTLRYGEALAARVLPIRNGWKAWVYVKPRLNRADETRQFPHPLNCNTSVEFTVRRVELSDWHLDERWGFDMDVAIRQRPILDEIVAAADEEALGAVLLRWSCDPAALKTPHLVEYPYPPQIHLEPRP